MGAQITKLSVDGRNVAFSRATLVEFYGWRVEVLGATTWSPDMAGEVRIEVIVDGGRYGGTARVAPGSVAAAASRRANELIVLRGLGELRRLN